MKRFLGYFCLLICLSCWGCQTQSPLASSLPDPSPQPVISQESTVNKAQPPSSAIAAVVKNLSQATGIPVEQLKIKETEPKTWSDGCLELPKPDEFCTQALVEGWRIGVTNGEKTWVYRTDREGGSLRQESQP